jgi:transposase InsO family protein
MLDIFTKVVKFYPMKKATCKAVMAKLDAYCKTVGKPVKILADRGTQFTAHAFVNKLKGLNIQLAYTAVRHPQANPVERYMRELGRLCRSYCSQNHKSWCGFLTKFEDWINNVVHFTNQVKPALLFNRDLLTELLQSVNLLYSAPQGISLNELHSKALKTSIPIKPTGIIAK